MRKRQPKLRIKASIVIKALARGEKIDTDWQAGYLEVLLIPKVTKYWQAINRIPVFLARHPGKPAPHLSREEHIAIGNRKGWAEYAGYVLSYGEGGCLHWNSVREEYYGHAASTAWDGVRRDTCCHFILGLVGVVRSLSKREQPPERIVQYLRDNRIEIIDDITETPALPGNAPDEK